MCYFMEMKREQKIKKKHKIKREKIKANEIIFLNVGRRLDYLKKTNKKIKKHKKNYSYLVQNRRIHNTWSIFKSWILKACFNTCSNTSQVKCGKGRRYKNGFLNNELPDRHSILDPYNVSS